MLVTTSPQCAQLSGWKSTQAAHPAKKVQANVMGSDSHRQRSVRTGWMNFSGRNIATDNSVTSSRISHVGGCTANMTSTVICQQPGKPENELSFVFMLVSAKYSALA